MTEREQKVYAYLQLKKGVDRPFASEAALLKEAKILLGMLGALTLREESVVKGRSDLLICYKGHFIACELKDAFGKPSQHQLKFIDDVREAGGTAGICRTLLEVFELAVLSG